jgi:translation initiation factor 4G
MSVCLQRVAEEVDDRDWRSKPVEPLGASAPRVAKEYQEAREPREPREAREPREPRQQQQQQPAAREPQQQAAAPQKQAAAAPQKQQAPQQQQAKPAATTGDSAKMARAADVGLQAYRPGAQLNPADRALRQIKGILNKLTPEKFERLLDQLLQVVSNADILQKTIAMVFENAVAQPTFCALYADLCLRLSRELPSFPPAGAGHGRSRQQQAY